MAPLVRDGEAVVLDPSAEFGRGDLVVIYFTTGKGDAVAWLKRLSMGVMKCPFPYKVTSATEIVPVVSFHSITPSRGYSITADNVLGIHKVVGKRLDDGTVDPSLVEQNAEHWRAQTEAPARQAMGDAA